VKERRSPRRRTLLAGKVVFGEGRTVNCTIRNISETGAKITLARGECIPSNVFLIDRKTATAYEAKVRWIKAPDFGLEFVNAYNLEPQLPAELRYLLGIWETFRPSLAGV
jgi:hypothetical protein